MNSLAKLKENIFNSLEFTSYTSGEILETIEFDQFIGLTERKYI